MSSLTVSMCSQVLPTSTGTASTAMTRGTFLAAGFGRTSARPRLLLVVVRIAEGLQSSSTACRRPTPWPARTVEQRHRDTPGVQRAEERHQVLKFCGHRMATRSRAR